MLGSGWSILKAPALKVTTVYIDPQNITCNPAGQMYKYLLTKVWLVLPDGSEVQLRDDLTDGAPLAVPTNCPLQIDGNRGRVWHSTDGSALTYITDADNGVVNFQLNGWVFTADGARFKIGGGSAGRCNKIIDRNGNVLDITYDDALSAVTYKDQLGREVIVQGGTNGATVTIKGYGLADRTYNITTGQIGALVGGNPVNLRSEYWSWQPPFLSGDYSFGQHAFGSANSHTDLFLNQQSAVWSATISRRNTLRPRVRV